MSCGRSKPTKQETLLTPTILRVQLAGRGVIDDVFSLCFGSVEGDGALMLGDVDLSEQDIQLQYTALLSSVAHPHYYSVQLDSLWVGDVQLAVRPVLSLQFLQSFAILAICVKLHCTT